MQYGDSYSVWWIELQQKDRHTNRHKQIYTNTGNKKGEEHFHYRYGNDSFLAKMDTFWQNQAGDIL